MRTKGPGESALLLLAFAAAGFRTECRFGDVDDPIAALLCFKTSMTIALI